MSDKPVAKSENDLEYLHYAEQLRPKEFSMLKMTFEELMEIGRKEGLITPEMEAQLEKEQIEAVEIYFDRFKKNHQTLAKILMKLAPEQRLVGLEPEERLAGLSEAERQELLRLLQKEQNQS